MYKFTGFTEKANLVLNVAIEIAENLGHTYIGSEHLLTGLTKDVQGAAGTVLSAKKITASKLEVLMQNSIGVGMPTVLTPDDITPRCKHIIENSIITAKSLGYNYVGTEHLLMSILKESESCASHMITRMGVSPQDLYDDLVVLMGGEALSGQKKSKKLVSSKSVTPTLNQNGRDLTEMAADNLIDPVIGRKEEIERVIQILCRRTKNNPCLIGEPGVGKTAVAEGLALKIAESEVPELLKDKRVIALDLTSMVAGTKYRGDFEEKVKNCINEVKKAQDVILFIDELHTLIGAGSAEGAVDAANILKPSLARGEIQVIGATTLEEYRKHIEKDAALERRFQPITVGEPTIEETEEILHGIKDKYETHHKVKITDEAITAAATLSARYISDRFLPDKAIDLIDEAASKVRLKAYVSPPELKELEENIDEANREKTAAINEQDFEKAASIRDKEKAMITELSRKKADWKERNSKITGEVTSHEIAQIISSWTGVPVVQITEEESEKLLKLSDELHKRIVGQNEAVDAVAKAIRRGRVGLKDPKRPIGSFIFLGPTGVGKTELCKALAQVMFGDENSIIRLDMSEFMESHTTSKLIGSPPGYVGYDEGGQLTEKVRRKPYCVVLFDEIEKAHPDVFNILLQILEDGTLTDSQGRKTDFKNAVIIMTSNIGARLISEKQNLGFAFDKDININEKKIRDDVMSELKKAFRPEFLNRVDEIIVFHKLTKADTREIVKRLLETLRERIDSLDIDIMFNDNVVKQIAENGYDDVYGARPLRRAIQSKIEDKLSELILEGTVKSGEKYVCDINNDEIVFLKNDM